jgi:hypothetical protein
LHSISARIEAIEPPIGEQLGTLEARIECLGEEVARLRDEMASSSELSKAVLRAIVTEEAENRRRLERLRSSPEFERAWDDPNPLVTVSVVTRGRAHELSQRSLPSILAQTHERLELIVIGDAAGAEAEDAVRALDDPRVTWRDLPHRFEWTDDQRKRWLVGSTMGRQEAYRIASGDWFVSFDDDDSMRPDCIESLLATARAERAEAAYGQISVHWSDGTTVDAGRFPPAIGHFSWAAAIHHTGLRFFGRPLVAAEFGLPGDWFLAERMLRVGVRFAMVERVLCDVFPSSESEAVRAAASSYATTLANGPPPDLRGWAN